MGTLPEKLDRLKNIIKDLHKGKKFDEVKKRFDTLLGEIDPSQIAQMEEELIREGMPAQEIQRLCDLHVSVFQSSLDQKEQAEAPEGHPVNTYMAENAVFSDLICSFDSIVKHLAKSPGEEIFGSIRFDLEETAETLAKVDIHYTRKENQLFPYLEKHNITGPSQVMWGIHDEIRAMIKSFKNALDKEDIVGIIDIAPKISRSITEMIYKENTILFPMALETLSENEWHDIRGGENDTVQFYSDTPDRIFPRSPGVIGRTVQNCHPPKSIEIVNRIVESFRSGEKDHADFRIEHKGRYVLIRYYAVRDDGAYKGTVEVTQDITDIRGLSGEQRLLDWDSGNNK